MDSQMYDTSMSFSSVSSDSLGASHTLAPCTKASKCEENYSENNHTERQRAFGAVFTVLLLLQTSNNFAWILMSMSLQVSARHFAHIVRTHSSKVQAFNNHQSISFLEHRASISSKTCVPLRPSDRPICPPASEEVRRRHSVWRYIHWCDAYTAQCQNTWPLVLVQPPRHTISHSLQLSNSIWKLWHPDNKVVKLSLLRGNNLHSETQTTLIIVFPLTSELLSRF